VSDAVRGHSHCDNCVDNGDDEAAQDHSASAAACIPTAVHWRNWPSAASGPA
jgi:hypothetical protein